MVVLGCKFNQKIALVTRWGVKFSLKIALVSRWGVKNWHQKNHIDVAVLLEGISLNTVMDP